ncbi:MAG: hypothetical protein V3S82_01730 [Dehalococcoidia bacterium]
MGFVIGPGAMRGLFVLATAFLVFGPTGCAPTASQPLRGTLLEADVATGRIAISTDDGRTVSLDLADDAPVRGTQGMVGLGDLQKGVTVYVEVDGKDGRVARAVEARQARAAGTIAMIEGNHMTVLSQSGERVRLAVTDGTRVRLRGDALPAWRDLRFVDRLEVIYDTEDLEALAIIAESGDAEISGILVGVKGDKVTIDTALGRRVLTVAAGAGIELEGGAPGGVDDLRPGDGVEVGFDLSTWTANRIRYSSESELEQDPCG